MEKELILHKEGNSAESKVKFNNTKIVLLAFTISLGGYCVGYNAGVAASVVMYLELSFPDITIA
jgi:hypothetical protein